jgi:hypothetical protein
MNKLTESESITALFYVIYTMHILTSIYHPTYTVCDTPFMTYISCTYFDPKVPSTKYHCNKGMSVNLAIQFLLLLIGMTTYIPLL